MRRKGVGAQKGATLVEVLVAAGILGALVLAANMMFAQNYTMRQKLERRGAEEDAKEFLRKFVDCAQTISTQQTSCNALGNIYLQLKDEDGNVVTDKWPEQTIFGNQLMVRSTCKTIGTDQYSLGIEWASVKNNPNGVLGDYKHLAEGTVATTGLVFKPLFAPIPLVCSHHPVAPCDNPASIVHSEISVTFPTTPSAVECKGGWSGSTRVFDVKEEEEKIVTIPTYSAMCGISVKIPTVSFEYDDEFALTYDNVILAASYYPRPAGATQPIKFDWGYVSGLYYNWDDVGSIPHCTSPKITGKILKALKCMMPTGRGVTTIKRGKLDVELDATVSQYVFDSMKSNTVHKIKMITFGNGVTVPLGDCYHSAFTVKIDMSYVP